MGNEVSTNVDGRAQSLVDLTGAPPEHDGGGEPGEGSNAAITGEREVGVANSPFSSVDSVVDLTAGQDGHAAYPRPNGEAMEVDGGARHTPGKLETGLKQAEGEDFEQSENEAEGGSQYADSLAEQSLTKRAEDLEEAEHPATEWILKRKRKRENAYPPMTTAQKTHMIAALKEKLQEFPAPLPKSLDKAPRTGQLPSPAETTDSASPNAVTTPEKKTKRCSKPSYKSLTTIKPKSRKDKKKTKSSDRKMPKLLDAQKKIIQLLVEFGAASTPKDVQEIVDVGGEILAGSPDGERSMDAEIKELLLQEGLWKQSAMDPDECIKAGLKEIMKKFCERYGIIPIGAVEAAECAMWQVRREV